MTKALPLSLALAFLAFMFTAGVVFGQTNQTQTPTPTPTATDQTNTQSPSPTPVGAPDTGFGGSY